MQQLTKQGGKVLPSLACAQHDGMAFLPAPGQPDGWMEEEIHEHVRSHMGKT